MKNVVAICMVAMVVAIGVVPMSSGAALAFHRVDLIGSLQGLWRRRTARGGRG